MYRCTTVLVEYVYTKTVLCTVRYCNYVLLLCYYSTTAAAATATATAATTTTTTTVRRYHHCTYVRQAHGDHTIHSGGKCLGTYNTPCNITIIPLVFLRTLICGMGVVLPFTDISAHGVGFDEESLNICHRTSRLLRFGLWGRCPQCRVSALVSPKTVYNCSILHARKTLYKSLRSISRTLAQSPHGISFNSSTLGHKGLKIFLATIILR